MESKIEPILPDDLNKLYGDEKTKKFVVHLIRAYLPATKVKTLDKWEKGQKHKCVICKTPLVTQLELISKSFDTIANDTTDNLKKSLVGKEAAFIGEKTTTCMCGKCVADLLGFVLSKLNEGDKHMAWVVKDMAIPELKKLKPNKTVPADKHREKRKEWRENYEKFDPRDNLKVYYKDEGKPAMLGDSPAFEKLKSLKTS